MDAVQPKAPHSPHGVNEEVVAEMSLRDYFRVFSRRRWCLLVPILLSLTAGVSYLAVSQPRYRCKAEILLPSSASSMPGAVSSLIGTLAPGLSTGGAYQPATEASVIRSWPLQEKALALLKAFPDFFRKCSEGKVIPQNTRDIPDHIRNYFFSLGPSIQPTSSSPMLNSPFYQGSTASPSNALGTAGSTSQLSSLPSKGLTDKELRDLLRKMRVGPAQQGNIVQLTVASRKPYDAADLLNALSVAYLLNDLQNLQLTSQQGLDYTAAQIEKAQQELARAEQAVADFQRRYGVPDVSESTKRLISSIATIRDTIATLDAEVAAQVAQDATLEEQLRQVSPTVISSKTISANPLIQSLTQQLVNLENQRATLLIDYTETSQPVRSIEAQIAAVREQLQKAAQEIATARTESPNPVYSTLLGQWIQGQVATTMAKARKQALERAAARIEAKLKTFPSVALELARLQRQAQIAQQKYLSLVQQYQQYQMTKDSKSTPLRILSPARIDDYFLTHPDWPKPVLVLALAFIIGALLGVITALTVEYVDERYPDAATVEADTGLSVLAQIPRLKISKMPLVTDEDCPEQVRDALASLWVNIRMLRKNEESLSVLFTSPRGGEGASWLLYNLGILTAQTGSKTVLVDCNLRHPSLHEYAGLPLSPGIAEILSGQAALDQCLHRTSWDAGELAVLPAGRAAGGVPSAAIWESKAFMDMFRLLGDQFDLILVDSPPVLLQPDALAIGLATSGAVLVVALSKNTYNEVRETVTSLRRGGVPIIGAIANRT
ncbi:MAG: hypothetical protein H5T86_00065 [Armatimonadetes bacterium]|nr:hypothetical protein [Armatimonadota bacterium]